MCQQIDFPSHDEVPHPSGDEFAYLVALYAWHQGLTANAIVRRLGWEPTSKNIMQVKRALKRAKDKFLKIKPPMATSLQTELSKRVNKGPARNIQFYVVDDMNGRGPLRESVYAKAAEVISQIICEVVWNKPPKETTEEIQEPDVFICNAGGRSIGKTVNAMQRNPPVLDESEEKAEEYCSRLEFVAANAAYLPDKFHQSANFLSVTMAEILGAGHMALPTVPESQQMNVRGKPISFLEGHRQRVDDAALFVCGAGAIEAGAYSGLMMHYLRERGFEIPKEAVGDLAFNLLDENGRSVALSPEAQQYMNRINPSLTLEALNRIVAENRVLLILDAENPYQKHKIGAAALKGRYATDVVLSARLAKAILEVF